MYINYRIPSIAEEMTDEEDSTCCNCFPKNYKKNPKNIKENEQPRQIKPLLKTDVKFENPEGKMNMPQFPESYKQNQKNKQENQEPRQKESSLENNVKLENPELPSELPGMNEPQYPESSIQPNSKEGLNEEILAIIYSDDGKTISSKRLKKEKPSSKSKKIQSTPNISIVQKDQVESRNNTPPKMISKETENSGDLSESITPPKIPLIHDGTLNTKKPLENNDKAEIPKIPEKEQIESKLESPKKEKRSSKSKKIQSNPNISIAQKDQAESRNNTPPKMTPKETENSDDLSESITSPKIPAIHDGTQNAKKPLENNDKSKIAKIPEKEQNESKLEIDRNVGLMNIGNSCYMNSVIQILASIPEFNAAIEDSASSPLLAALKNVISVLLSHHSLALDTVSYLVAFRNIIAQEYPMFKGPIENDAKELFSIIAYEADQLSPNSKQFALTKTQAFTCSIGHQSNNPEENNFLVVPKDKQGDLQNVVVLIGLIFWCSICHHLKSHLKSDKTHILI
ncbi:unnamed protein product [Blepharisma stoltei]|uniref:ubiquitinyl hydrolase 1 n=1 Tax=Blepharisma stoltei TaxID=1481888 RepID=A0AAU9J9X8_9CILI|nr:unnamed protein product [Blepharisma stoltei]